MLTLPIALTKFSAQIRSGGWKLQPGMSNWIYFVIKFSCLYYASVSVFLSPYVCLSFPECEFSYTDHFADPLEYPNHCSCSVTNLWVDPHELQHARHPCPSLWPQRYLPWNTNILSHEYYSLQSYTIFLKFLKSQIK